MYVSLCLQAVRNFVQLCLEGYYDGCIFHRVIKDFMAQTGDPTGTGSGGGPGCWHLNPTGGEAGESVFGHWRGDGREVLLQSYRLC